VRRLPATVPSPSVMLEVAGAPGIGKTSLLTEFAARARELGFSVLNGGWSAAGGQARFGAFGDALEEAVERTGIRAIADLRLEDAVRELFSDPSPRVPAPAVHRTAFAQAATLRSLRYLLERLAEAEPTVLILDDVHHADPAGIAMLQHLLRRPVRGRLLIVLSHRPRQSEPALLADLMHGRRSGAVDSLTLPPLRREQFDQLAADILCETHRRAAPDECGGVPGYLDVIAAACAGPGRCDGTPVAAITHPHRPELSAALASELYALEADVLRTLQAAAVVGECFDAATVAEISVRPESAVLTDLDELIRRDLVIPADARTFRFRHPLLAAVAYWSVPVSVGWSMAALHRGCVRCEQSQCASAQAPPLALAAQAGADTGSARAGSEQAGGNALEDQLAVYAAAAEQDLLGGDILRSVRSVAAHDGLSAGSWHSSSAAVAEHRASLAGMAGRHLEARRILQAAIAATGRSAGEAATARLRLALAAGSWDDLHVVSAPRWSEDALLTALAGGELLNQVEAVAVEALVRLARGFAAMARRLVPETARLLEVVPEEQLVNRLTVLSVLARAELELELYAAARQHVALALALGRRTGQWYPVFQASVVGGAVALRSGDREAAGAHAAEALRLAGTISADEPMVQALLLRADTVLHTAPQTALDSVTQASAMVSPMSPMAPLASVLMAEAQLRLGDASAALHLIGDQQEHEMSRLPTSAAVRRCVVAARAEQDHAQAQRWAQTGRQLATRATLPRLVGTVAVLQAELADRVEDGLSYLEEAAQNFTSSSAWADLVRTHLAVAVLQHSAGDSARADQALQLARAQASGPLAWLAEEVKQTSAQLAPAPSALGTVRSLDSLSPRERQIARLLSRGRTNQQIARALDVSPKTVETHLGRIFSKADVSSRAEVAYMVGRAEVDEAG
jgi:DNA-binding NarL/FixJ family response regulator